MTHRKSDEPIPHRRTITDYNDAAKATEKARMKASAVVAADAEASQAADQDDQKAQADLAKALHKIGPWVDLAATPPMEKWSDDGVSVQHKVVQTGDVEVPDDAPPAPPATGPGPTA